MYTEGTSALKREYFEELPSEEKVQKENPVRKPVKKSVNTRLLKKRVVCAMLIAFVMAFTVLIRHAIIAKEYGELSKAKEELELINAKVVEKQVAANGNLDPKKIDQEAQRLGLQQPDQSQVKYISLGNDDAGEVLKTEETSTLNAFVDRVSGILEYLY